jgi:hypothetical protein
VVVSPRRSGGILDQPAQSIANYLTRLSDGDRLAALQVDDDPQAAVRAAFEVSLVALPEPAQRLFRLLGLVPGADFTVAAATALADLPPDRVAALLDRLAAVNLVNQHADPHADQHGADRFGFHDLLRLFAAEWCAAARRRYPHMQRLPQVTPADSGIVFDTGEAALAWLDAKRLNLVAAVRYAAEHGPRPTAWVTRCAATSGCTGMSSTGSPSLRAGALIGLAACALGRHRYAEADRWAWDAQVLAHGAGLRIHEAQALGLLAEAARGEGRADEVARYAARVREIGPVPPR